MFRLGNASSALSGVGKQASFAIKVKVDPTGEIYTLEVSNEMKISELMSQLEFLTGIPVHIQRLWYLDEGDLQPETDVRYNTIVPDGEVHVNVRYTWYKIIDAVYSDDIDELMTQGVTPGSPFTSPNLDYLARWHPKEREAAINDRSLVALYMAAHRGRLNLVTKLLQAGSDVNAVTPRRRTALHVAASRGHGDVMDVLLEHGAEAEVEDVDGETPSSIALKHGHKDCDRHLFMFRWQQRAKNRLKQTKTSKNG